MSKIAKIVWHHIRTNCISILNIWLFVHSIIKERDKNNCNKKSNWTIGDFNCANGSVLFLINDEFRKYCNFGKMVCNLRSSINDVTRDVSSFLFTFVMILNYKDICRNKLILALVYFWPFSSQAIENQVQSNLS